ncbi:universal stress protein [Streptomyces sp. A1136]|uniref:universal stress protein n=1 Tax=Streptomyces sp. A1136 TaxID=2563102 RepID=UPI00109E92E7|nr:universal stress protein [Streptomyces sp. A1136]THA50324.1 universal stress protein [Streptomyces sp. A1136]
MTVIAWLVEGTWAACAEAARRFAPTGADIVLLHIDSPDVGDVGHGAFAGLLGRVRAERDPGTAMEHLASATADRVLAAAGELLGRPHRAVKLTGRPETEVVAAAEGADLLVLVRDGDHSRLGPRSLGPTSRFVVDHAPCPVLLVWPDAASLSAADARSGTP